MIYKKIYFNENNKDVYLEVYAANKIGAYIRKAILIIPGGAYSHVCDDREGEPIGLAFLPFGYNAFVLHYSVGRTKAFPEQLIQASWAIMHIKDNAKEYNIDTDQVFVAGFSAGGHLAACLGTMWHKKEVCDALNISYAYNRPKGMMLIYPVVSGIDNCAHNGSFKNLLCSDNPSEEELAMCSIERNVDGRTCPAYIMHTSNDSVVNVRNSLLLAETLAANNILFELHIYPDAPHGVALGNAITECGNKKFNNASIAKWIENAVMWAEQIPNSVE